jgi:chemotaxis response regulator CheB
MRAILVDDERLARRELRRLLCKHPQVEVIGEAANADEARVLLSEGRPDLIFLDVQMPGESGFDLLMKLVSFPAIIFTTAFDQFALKAFEFGAYDVKTGRTRSAGSEPGSNQRPRSRTGAEFRLAGGGPARIRPSLCSRRRELLDSASG